MHLINLRKVVFLLLCSGFLTAAQAQRGMMKSVQGMGSRFSGGGGGRSGGGGSDSLSFEKRKFADDSVNVRFRYLDTARYSGFDSSISDYFRRMPVKPEMIQIGHYGNAIRSLLYSPLRKPGWDAGFHALDPFAFTIADTRFMNTTKPYTELGYLVGSQVEQHISVLHTQNIRPNWNFVFHYRLYNAPGTFNSQNTNHNNIRFNSDFTSENQRYHAYVILINNALQSSENGGIVDPDLLVNENPAYNDRFNIPTQLASTSLSSRNFFNVKLGTGNRYVDKHALFRQRYDFGKKDSVKTDSSVIRFFLPKLSFEHTAHISSYLYRFLDVQAAGASDFYKTNYDFAAVPDTLDFKNQWNVVRNDFSVIQFPDSKNLLQFFKAGATLMNFSSVSDTIKDRFLNIMVHGEYRNTTRNKKWDMMLYGEFYSAGRDLGNYAAQARLQRSLGRRIGTLEIGFQNINRSPSYLQVYKTGFPIEKTKQFNNENVTALSGSLYISALKAKLSFEYFLQSNYTYFKDFKTVDQYAPLFNFARAGLSKETSLGKKWKWYLDLYLQEAIGDVPINLPRGYVRTRLAYEGKPFRNLVMASGLDLRYYTAYYADDYSPVNGQFFYQNLFYVQNRPDVTAYFNFRIRSFTAYVRLENLNTATRAYGFGFKKNNVVAPFYPNPGMVFRLGIFWNFVN